MTEDVPVSRTPQRSSPPAGGKRRSPGKKKDPFYFVMAIIALAIVVAGFFPTYVSPVMSGTFIAKPFVHLHGSVFFLWILMSIVQPYLITSGNVRMHRWLGVYVGILAFAVLIMGVAMSIISAHVDIANGGDIRPKAFLLIPLTDMILFAVFVVLGLFNYRRVPEYHKRLMLLAAVSILPAAFARLLGNLGLENIFATVLIMNSFVFIGMMYDFRQNKSFHKVYVFGGAFLLIIHFSRIFLSETELWLSIASRILSI
jgi:hypothetical protein